VKFWDEINIWSSGHDKIVNHLTFLLIVQNGQGRQSKDARFVTTHRMYKKTIETVVDVW
jgi:hypothetical protein